MSDERSANAVDREIGERLRQRRLAIGMTQERLAQLAGVTFQQIQKYEKGVNRIAASRLFSMAAILEIDIGSLFEGLSGHGARASARHDETGAALATPGARELVLSYAAVDDPRLRRRILDLVKTMSQE